MTPLTNRVQWKCKSSSSPLTVSFLLMIPNESLCAKLCEADEAKQSKTMKSVVEVKFYFRAKQEEWVTHAHKPKTS